MMASSPLQLVACRGFIMRMQGMFRLRLHDPSQPAAMISRVQKGTA